MSMGTAVTKTVKGMSSGHASNGGRLVAVDGRVLPLRGVTLRAEAAGGIARTILTQRFANPYEEALQVTYSVPLPAEGAVAGYAFVLADRRIVGEIDRKAAARERFEAAVLEGRTAALLDQERVNLFTQEIGNLPPGQEVTVELTVDQRLRWLAEGAWEWRFPTVVPPRYLGAEGRVPDAGAVTVDVADHPTGAGAALELAIADALAEGRSPESPSHRLTARAERGSVRVAFIGTDADGTSQPARAALDRDVVVRWAVAQPRVGLSLAQARPATGPLAGSAYGLLTIVPPAVATRAVPRDLVVLLDTSGSMGGTPLAHARRVVSALVDGLVEQDRLELIAFSSEAERWKSGPVPATPTMRRDALAWLGRLEAGGGTEMASAVTEALRPLRGDALRQVLLVTDGHIGFETEVVKEVLTRLPAGSRLHTVGVGSSVNRALTGPAARAGRGIEIVVDLDEDAERGAARLVAATRAPLLVELEVEGEAVQGHAPRGLPDLLAGAPALVSVKLRPQGGTLVVRGRTAEGPWETTMTVAAADPGAGNGAVTALFGREAVEDLETEIASGAHRRENDQAIERLGLQFQISTRLTSWVAVSSEVTVDPRAPVRRERMPHELPYGLSAEGLGLRGAGMPGGMPMQAMALGGAASRTRTGTITTAFAPPPAMKSPAPARPSSAAPLSAGPKQKRGFLGRAVDALREMAADKLEDGRARGGDEDDTISPAPSYEQGIEVPDLELEAPEEERSRVLEPRAPGAGSGTPYPTEEPPPPPRAPAKHRPVLPEPASAPAVRVLRGRRLGAPGGRELVIEAGVEDEPLVWHAPLQAALVLADGTRLLVAVEMVRTTRDGLVPAGAALRIAVALPPGTEGATAAALEIESGGVTVRIELV